jgi:hypothetical protein
MTRVFARTHQIRDGKAEILVQLDREDGTVPPLVPVTVKDLESNTIVIAFEGLRGSEYAMVRDEAWSYLQMVRADIQRDLAL